MLFPIARSFQCHLNRETPTCRGVYQVISIRAVVAFLFVFWGSFLTSLIAQTPEWVVAGLVTVPVLEEVVGTLQPKTITMLSSKVMGNVLEVLKREGEMVEVGELVVKIDAREIGNDLQGARANLSEVQAASDEVESLIAKAQAAKNSSEHEANLAEVSFNRIKELYEKKSVTQQEFDQVQTRLLQARSSVTQADAQIAGLRAKLAQIAARNTQARAGIDKVSTMQRLAEVRAPFAGRIVSRKVEPGMLAAPGVPLLGIEDVGRNRFEAIIPERLIRFLPEGATVSVKIDAVGEEEIPGNVVELVPGADPHSHTFLVRIFIPDDARFRTGMYVRGTVRKGEEALLLVPQSSIERRGQLEGLVVPVEGKPIYRLIKTGRKYGDLIEVLSGLNPGEQYAKIPVSRQ